MDLTLEGGYSVPREFLNKKYAKVKGVEFMDMSSRFNCELSAHRCGYESPLEIAHDNRDTKGSKALFSKSRFRI